MPEPAGPDAWMIEAAQVEQTYGPPLERLSSWDMRARTAASASDALFLARQEIDFLSDMGEAMYCAATGYLLQVSERARWAANQRR